MGSSVSDRGQGVEEKDRFWVSLIDVQCLWCFWALGPPSVKLHFSRFAMNLEWQLIEKGCSCMSPFNSVSLGRKWSVGEMIWSVLWVRRQSVKGPWQSQNLRWRFGGGLSILPWRPEKSVCLACLVPSSEPQTKANKQTTTKLKNCALEVVEAN